MQRESATLNTIDTIRGPTGFENAKSVLGESGLLT